MNTAATTYTVRVDGHLDDHWSNRLCGFTITRDAGGTTTLVGEVSDQAQLHGLLTGLRDIGATLLELHADARSPHRDRGSAPVRGSRLVQNSDLDSS